MAQVDFDGVETGLDGKPGRVRVRGNHALDIGSAGTAGEFHAQRVEEPDRGQGT